MLAALRPSTEGAGADRGTSGTSSCGVAILCLAGPAPPRARETPRTHRHTSLPVRPMQIFHDSVTKFTQNRVVLTARHRGGGRVECSDFATADLKLVPTHRAAHVDSPLRYCIFKTGCGSLDISRQMFAHWSRRHFFGERSTGTSSGMILAVSSWV